MENTEMTNLAVATETAAGLWQVASALGTTADALADRAIRSYLRQEAEKKIRREEQFFRLQHAQLLDRYRGQFIAMHEGQIIDADADELTLYSRVRQRFPMIGILIKQVSSEVEEVWAVRSPRIEYE